MADSKISALSAITSLADTDEMVVASSGASKKITGLNLKASMPGTGGGGGVGALLYSHVLATDTASIDTGAGGIAGGYNILEAFIVVQTTDAAAQGNFLNITVNNDTGANYDRQVIGAQGSGFSAGAAVAQSVWLTQVHGASGSAGYPSMVSITIPDYTGTAFNKVGVQQVLIPDGTSGNLVVGFLVLGYRSTSAITRMAVSAATGGKNLKAGSAMYIYGR